MRIGTSASPYQNHQDAFQADALSRAVRQQTQARITTRDIGFSIGGFGVRWSSSDVEFDSAAEDAREAARQEAAQSRAFLEEMDVAAVRDRMVENATGLTPALNPAADAQAGASSFAYALSAYTRTAALASFEPLPGRVLGVA